MLHHRASLRPRCDPQPRSRSAASAAGRAAVGSPSDRAADCHHHAGASSGDRWRAVREPRLDVAGRRRPTRLPSSCCGRASLRRAGRYRPRPAAALAPPALHTIRSNSPGCSRKAFPAEGDVEISRLPGERIALVKGVPARNVGEDEDQIFSADVVARQGFRRRTLHSFREVSSVISHHFGQPSNSRLRRLAIRLPASGVRRTRKDLRAAPRRCNRRLGAGRRERRG